MRRCQERTARGSFETGRPARPAAGLHLQRLARDPLAAAAVAEVVRAHRVTTRELLSRTRGAASVAAARQIAMYLLHVSLGRPQEDVGRIFRRDPSTVSYACHIVEDRRDDPDFEAEIARLEALLSSPEAEELRHAG